MKRAMIKARVLVLYKRYDVVYGPYANPHMGGRKHAVLYNSEPRRRRTVSWARLKMEAKLKRRLREGEEVDHRDDDFTNDRFSNLQILSGQDNKRKELKRRGPLVQTPEMRERSKARLTGQKNINAQFTDAIVVKLRMQYTAGMPKARRDYYCAKYGISDRAMRDMMNRVSYTHL